MEKDTWKLFGGCGGCITAILVVNLTLGGFCFDYCLQFIFGKDIHFMGDIICGLFLGELAIPAAVICFVLNLFGIEAPLVGG